MVETLFKSIDSNCEISTLKRNDKYGFEIKLAVSKDWNTQLIFTDGLSAKEQDVKAGYEAYKKIELYFLLPSYWDLQAESWPIEWINRLAEIPQKNETWFGPGDTIPAGNPPEILSDRFPANHFMLVEPFEVKSFFDHDVLQKTGIQFFGIVPICKPELDYKIRNSATVLFGRLKKNNHSEKVDLFRTSVCRKRILGF